MSLWIFHKTMGLDPHARGQMVLMVKAEGNWKNKLELLKERWLKAQLFL